jgi:hypothetical protein
LTLLARVLMLHDSLASHAVVLRPQSVAAASRAVGKSM